MINNHMTRLHGDQSQSRLRKCPQHGTAQRRKDAVLAGEYWKVSEVCNRDYQTVLETGFGLSKSVETAEVFDRGANKG